jgi:hypothetical protein
VQRANLPDDLRYEVDLIEESILADPQRTHLRREGPDGTIIDLTGYDAHGIMLSFRLLPGVVEFVALAIAP